MGQAEPVDPAREDREPDIPVWPFRSWRSLYATVVVYAFLLMLFLYLLSVNLDYSGGL